MEHTFTEVSITGALSIRSVPDGADITLSGVSTGFKTPHNFEQVAPGTVTFSLNLSGHDAYSGSATVFAGQQTISVNTLIISKPVNVPVSIVLYYSVTQGYGQYTIDVSGVHFSGGKWLITENPDQEMRDYAKSKIPSIIGRDMISADILYINGILQSNIPPTEGQTRIVNCPKNGRPINQIYQNGQWRTQDLDVHICEDTDYVTIAIKAGVALGILSSLLG